MSRYTTISLEYSVNQRIATVTLQRPEVHNALNPVLIAELTDVFTELARQDELHAVVLAAAGRSFCAGADITTMQAAVHFTKDENIREAERLADLLAALDSLPCPVIAQVQGAAIGGGAGLVAVCDLVVAVESATFAFSEVKLGIAPAMIAPYVLRKIGENQARALFITGERFSALRAREIGLVHTVVPSEQLDETLLQLTKTLSSNPPQALRACKKLASSAGHLSSDEARSYTTRLIAQLRTWDEGQEGLTAFLEKRAPRWRLE